jgi:Antirepressor regulating drug resistance, predicted signal transduction N-terminal membrane component
MVIGLLRPVVLLPRINIPPDELPLILRHELVHYKRKDLWYKVLMMVTSAIHWFNPIVHLMVRSALNLCEISCDEEVLKGHDAKGRAQYGEAIIGVVRNGSAYHTALSTNFYSGTKGRIYAIMDMSKKRFSPVLFIAILIITICGTTAFALSPVKAEGILQNLSKEAVASTGKSKPDSEDSTVQPSSASDVKLNNQEKQSDDALTNKIVPTLQLTPENTSTKQSNDLASVSNESRLVSGDLQFSENTSAKSSQVQPQNLDTNKLVPGDTQPYATFHQIRPPPYKQGGRIPKI